ncbi:splicing factor 3B subunit 2-like [Anneissia japonica]|uniref:splicing factor 3B subunit 2-like n=1 Tax=Anneissia japonica TaxID=1529436 RepID=UPI0014255A8A|nr:splicing factor 3B subunit 2-like [Anneissia japonica]
MVDTRVTVIHVLEEARIAELQRQEQERLREEAGIAELQRQEQERLREEARIAELQRQEQERLREEARIAELQRQEQERLREEARIAELQRQEQERLRQEARIADEQRQEQERILEETCIAEQRRVDQQRLIEEARIAEQQRLEEQRREEERRKEEVRLKNERMLEQQRLEKQRVAEQKRQEQLRIMEEKRIAQEQEQRQRSEQLLHQQIKRQEEQGGENLYDEGLRIPGIDDNTEVDEEFIEQEKERILLQQQERLQQMQKREKEKQKKALQQQQMLADEQMRNELAREKAKEEELYWEQQRALHLQEEETKVRQQQQMLQEQREQQHRGALLRSPPGRVPTGQPAPNDKPFLHQIPGQKPPSLMSKEVKPALRPPGVDDDDDEEDEDDNEEEEKASESIRLPQALEKVLQFKDVRAQEIGGTEDDDMQIEAEDENEVPPQEEEDEDEEVEKEVPKEKKLTKNQRRKKKKKKRQAVRRQQQQDESRKADDKDGETEDVVVEYIPETLDVIDPTFREFRKVFEAFKLAEAPKVEPKKAEQVPAVKAKETKKETEKNESDSSSDEEDMSKVEDDTPKISKKKLRKLNRLSVAELKQLVSRPDVVEMHDVTARDPKLLVHLKSSRNTVPVPRHWCFKRKYLQGKRGIEKPPFELPEFIRRTGIMEMRQALQEKEDQQTMKTKMRQKVRPKMGKIDIDYQKLHDAFFRWQTKPKMTIHGQLYYEGKEFETKLKEKKPGDISDDLRVALGMPVGSTAQSVPPPWLIAMQRYGPPPSYPNLKIMGLNSPIPEGCSFGYHAGGWGKPPVDETGKPLYGDVFGTNASDFKIEEDEEPPEMAPWGELESESEEESDEEGSEDEEEEKPDDTGLITPADGGLITPSGVTSVTAGLETPEMIELRKKKIEDAMDQGGETPALYTILPEKRANVGGAMMGSAHVYDIGAAAKKPGQSGSEVVAIALDPSELDLDTAAMAAKYEEQVREQQSHLEKEDFSDMVAEHAAKQKNKRKKQTQDTGRAPKKYKEFKF